MATGGFSSLFIRRPIATSLLMAGLFLVGAAAYPLLPIAPLPQVDFPTIQVSASLPGASPETMASAVAQPLERQFSEIPGVTQLTSTSSTGSTAVTIQFDGDLKEVARRHAQRVGRPVWETWLLEPGLHALMFYRAARWCFQRGWVFPARCLSAWGRRSGCDLSPAAKIGRNLIIQQATGVVVGPTAVIGDDCILEPGAMLLGSGLALPTADAPLDAYGTSRTHPQLGNGGWMPRPRKESAASESTAEPMPSVAMTRIGPIMLGRICVNMMRRSP